MYTFETISKITIRNPSITPKLAGEGVFSSMRRGHMNEGVRVMRGEPVAILRRRLLREGEGRWRGCREWVTTQHVVGESSGMTPA